MATDAQARMSAAATADAFRTGARSAVEIAQTALDAAATDELGAFWHVLAERALTRAAELDTQRAEGAELGPLTAVPFAAKDCFDVAGVPTSCGISGDSALAEPAGDAPAIELLEQAGAVLIAKTSMDQLAWGMSGFSPGFPPTRNPADPTRMPGGSSGGSAAAVGSGALPLALGTDAGGSVRQPAGWCGIVGFKPTLGAIPTSGCAPMAPSLDTVGVFSRDVADQLLALDALAPGLGSGSGAGAAGAASTRRLGVVEAAFEGVDPAVARSCEETLQAWETHGATLVKLDLPWVRRGLGTIFASELAASWVDVVDAADGRLLPTVRSGLEHGAAIDAVSYVKAAEALRDVRRRAATAVAELDVVAGPTSPIVAPPLSDPDPTAIAGRNTRVYNGLGWPAISVPVAADALPIGLQLAAGPGRDAELLALARELADVVAL